MPGSYVTNSIVFEAACNQAVDSSLRPIRRRVINRLRDRLRSDPEVASLFAAVWTITQTQADEPPTPAALMESRFVELIASDPQWKTQVLDAVVEERRWSDLWSKVQTPFFDRVASLLEKLTSPDHPVAKRTTAALASFAAALLTIWLPVGITGRPDIYEKLLGPLAKIFQSKNQTTIERKIEDAQVRLKVLVDPKDLSVSFKPIVTPDAFHMKLHPVLDAPLKITPQFQYSHESTGNSTTSATKLTGLKLQLIPAIDLASFPKGLWDPQAGLKVSVNQLDAPSQAPSASENSATQEGIPVKGPGVPSSGRPLDKIEAKLGALNKNLENIGGDFQASKADPQSTLATMQQRQNAIHSIANNQGRTTVIDLTPNSVRSVVLQWFGDDEKPQFCTLTLEVGAVDADNVDLSLTNQQCSPNASLVDKEKIPYPLSFGPADDPQQVGPWSLSVDSTHRHWVFRHAARLRFTWQPASSNSSSAVQSAQKLP
jgi:hypothetical protein